MPAKICYLLKHLGLRVKLHMIKKEVQQERLKSISTWVVNLALDLELTLVFVVVIVVSLIEVSFLNKLDTCIFVFNGGTSLDLREALN